MPRKRCCCPPVLPVHVVQHGNNRQVCFADDADLKAYAQWLRDAAEKYGVEVHTWIFMTNHMHLLVTPSSADSISRCMCMQYLGRYYVRRFNYRYQRSGTLFEGWLKSSIVQSRAYLLVCQRYIELNTGLVMGDGRFRAEVEQLTGQPQQPRGAGADRIARYRNSRCGENDQLGSIV